MIKQILKFMKPHSCKLQNLFELFTNSLITLFLLIGSIHTCFHQFQNTYNCHSLQLARWINMWDIFINSKILLVVNLFKLINWLKRWLKLFRDFVWFFFLYSQISKFVFSKLHIYVSWNVFIISSCFFVELKLCEQSLWHIFFKTFMLHYDCTKLSILNISLSRDMGHR